MQGKTGKTEILKIKQNNTTEVTKIRKNENEMNSTIFILEHLRFSSFKHGDEKKILLEYENILLVRCVADGNGGGNVVGTLENMANFVVDNNGDYKDPPPHGGELHNGPQRG